MNTEKTIEEFINFLLNRDPEITIIYSRIAMEKDQVAKILIDFFITRGIYTVPPFKYASLIRDKTIEILNDSPEIIRRKKRS